MNMNAFLFGPTNTDTNIPVFTDVNTSVFVFTSIHIHITISHVSRNETIFVFKTHKKYV